MPPKYLPFYKTNLGSEIINICIYSADCKIATSTNTTFEPDATYQEKEMVFVPYTTLCYSRLLLPFEILNGYIFFKSLDLQPFKISIMSNWRCVNKICTNKQMQKLMEEQANGTTLLFRSNQTNIYRHDIKHLCKNSHRHKIIPQHASVVLLSVYHTSPHI